MRRAILISIGFHAFISLLVFQWVSFRQVSYVPRQVYDVTLVTPAVAEPAPRVVRPVVQPDPPAPEPVPEEKDEEMPPPPDEPKKKPPVKKETKKQVPTTQIQKTIPPAEADTSGQQMAAPPTGSISFEHDFPFAHYIGRMRQKIAATWRPPGGSPEERACRVYFRVHRDGSVSNVAVEESSGLSLFDQSCQRAVLQSAPLPPLPREFKDAYLGVHFSFLYRESE
ncbi:MAG: TonB family protein [Candidatus Krumholzibacteria bacterium]|nr:TonB family protein [Candidatus Krumholzibacteria bacterium]MDH4336035.1 TonB family protein [Candidatus Krumholzibacteria bacterium]MDH5268389.1 TonB family protein [Candidatus Krumholzibacteria bacterium]